MQVKCIMQQFIRRLAYLHAHGIVHRDLKVWHRLYATHPQT